MIEKKGNDSMTEIRLKNTWFRLTRGQVSKSIRSRRIYGDAGHSPLDYFVIHMLLHG